MIEPGDKVKHYEIIKSIGKGGMGEVFLARDTVLDRQVAIKFLPEEMQKDVKARERFLREAKSAAALDHPFICQIYETGEFEGKAFIAMEYVEGENLSQKMAEGHIPLRDAIQTTLEVAEALEVAHKKGIVHRDLKPANIMLTAQGHAKVMDFGLAKHIMPGEESLTKTLTQTTLTEKGTIVGTIAYMSPEQARGEAVDGRSDIFALGIILHEMVSGKNPFSKPTPIETLTSILRDSPPSPDAKPKTVNPLLTPILRRALAKEPEKRYMEVKELIADLQNVQKSLFGGFKLLYRKLPLIAGAAVIVIAVLVVVMLKFVFPTKVSAPKKAPEPISVLIADVQNKTGDSAFDRVLETTLGFSLDNAAFISVYDSKQAHQQAIKKKPGSEGHIDPDLAQLICRSIGINAVINSSIESSNGGYLIKSWAVDSSTSKELARVEQKISSKQDVLKVSDTLAAKLQSGLVKIPPDSTEAMYKETFTTTSLEAMKAYAEAQELDALGKEEEAVKAYQRAIDHDPNFGRAYAGLGATFYNRGDYQNAEKYYKEAVNRIDQMTEREKHRTLGGYYLATHNYKKAIDEYSALVKEFPKDVAGHTNLAFANFLGYRMLEAFQEGEHAVELDPEHLDYRYNQSWYALAYGDFDRARQEANKALEIDPTYAKAFVVLALAEIAQDRPNRAAEVYRQLEALSPFGASLASAGLADLAVYEGRLNEAIAILEKSIPSDLKSGSKYRPADKYLILAQVYLLQGKKELAVQAADRALQTFNREELQFAAAQIFIEAGREDKARNIAGELNLKVQAIHHAYAKLIGGYLSLKRGDIANALKLFEEAQNYVDTWLGRFALGRSYLEAGAFTEAYSEFDKCKNRMGEAMSIFLVNDLPTFRYLDSLYYYLGRAQEGLGSPAAKESYQKFLKIKEKADPGNKLIEDARKRLNSL